MNLDQNSTLTIIAVGLCTAVAYYLVSPQALKRTFPRLWSLANHWQSLIKSSLSPTLSTSEQSNFEEEFKYLIVTSSLFNETKDQQPFHKSVPKHSDMKQKEQIKEFSDRDLTVSLLSVSALCSVLAILLTKSNYYTLASLGGLGTAYIAACYFIYRHHKRVQIRKIHASALDSMHEIISLSQESDTTLLRLLKAFHHQQPSNDQEQQQVLGAHLSTHFETYIETVHQLQPLIDAHNISRLRDMYGINQEIPHMLLEFESHQYKAEDLDLIYSMIGWKRREYLLYLLALDVMSNNRTAHYGKNWRRAIQINKDLVKEYAGFNKELSLIAATTIHDATDRGTGKLKRLESDSSVSSQYDAAMASNDSATTISDEKCLALAHRIAAVEKHIEEIQATLFLCKQDKRSLSSGRVSGFSLERMSKRFTSIDESITSLSKQWEESKQSLNTLLDDEQLKLKTSAHTLPSPPSSPRDFRHSMSLEDDDTHMLINYLNKATTESNRPSFTNERLHRIQSLKLANSNRQTPVIESNIASGTATATVI